MKEGYHLILFISCFVGLLLGILIPMTIRLQEKDNTEIDDGTITKKEFEDEGFGPGNYIITLDNDTEYDVSENDYQSVDVGDKVIVYESGRVEKE